jgi:tetratricopeptide (TPR) repeat protein
LARLDGLLKKYQALSSWLLILVATVVYQGALACGFVYDDVHLILQNPFLKNPHLWRRIFQGSLFSFDGPSAQTGFYRPLTIFSYWLICRVAGFNPAAYHLVLLALYALSIWIVYRLGRKLLQNELAAFAGALLWSVLPLHVEVVAWVSSLSDVGCTLFCLLGFWMFLRAEEHSPASLRWHMAAAAVYFPALFFKEMAFSFPLVLLAYWFCYPSAQSWFRRALHWLPYVAAAALCAVIRVAVMGHFSQASSFWQFHSQAAWAAIGLLGQHAKLFFWPVNLSEFRGFDLAASLRSPWPWATLLVIAMACVWRRRNPRLSFLVLWWGVTLLPALNYRQLTIPYVADRFSYLGSVGLCLALAYLAFVWLPWHDPKGGHAWVAAGALTAVAMLWAAQTMRMVPHWRDNDTLYDYSLRVSPNNAEVHVTHGVVLQLRDNDLVAAAREFRTALRLNAQSLQPSSAVVYSSYIGLGQVALNQGREPEALAYFNQAVHLMPNSGFAYEVLGSVYFPHGDYARAAEYFQQAVRVNPQDLGARFFLGTCWLKLGKPAQAAEQFHAAREVDPDYFQAYEAEARALEAAGDKTEAARVRALIPKH